MVQPGVNTPKDVENPWGNPRTMIWRRVISPKINVVLVLVHYAQNMMYIIEIDVIYVYIRATPALCPGVAA